MKRTKLLISMLAACTFLYACGAVGLRSDKDYGVNMAKAISTGNLQEIANLDPQLNDWAKTYITNSTQAEKVTAFLIDMVKKAEEKEPGTTPKVLLMLQSNNEKLVEMGLSLGREKLMEQIGAYAGTVTPEAVFNKIYQDY